MVEHDIVLGHMISNKGIEVDLTKIIVFSQLPYPCCVREVRSFLGHAGFYRTLPRISTRRRYHCPNYFRRIL